MEDSSTNPEFIRKAAALFPTRSFSLLDLGCADGRFVSDVLEQGYIACGLEGSDFPLARRRGRWPELDKNLFCCDVSENYTLSSDLVAERTQRLTPFRFDMVTAWEVMEHFEETQLVQVFQNVREHLMPDGAVALSVSSQPGFHHRTIQPREWWLKLFRREGFEPDEEVYRQLDPHWVRGPREPMSFNVALRRHGWRVV